MDEKSTLTYVALQPLKDLNSTDLIRTHIDGPRSRLYIISNTPLHNKNAPRCFHVQPLTFQWKSHWEQFVVRYLAQAHYDLAAGARH